MVFQGKGYQIHYEQFGSGKDVVLLHGWGGAIDSWKPLIRDLSTKMRVTVLDFPGHGQSTQPPEAWSVTEYANAVAEWLKAIGIGCVDVVAHSFGGRVAIVLAASYPEMVGRLVLTGVPVPGLIERRVTMRQRIRSGLYKLLKGICVPALFGEKCANNLREALIQRFGSPDYRALLPEMRPTFNRVIGQNLAVYLPEIKNSTLLIWGDKDTAAPVDIAQKLENTLADAGLVIFEGADHFAYLGEYMRFYTIVQNFLLEG